MGPGASGVTFENVAVSCPQCGRMARLGDGIYSVDGDQLRLDAGPLNTRQMISELQRIAEAARENKLTTEEILAEIADVSPDLARKLRGIGSWPVLGLALVLFWIIKSFTLDVKIDFNWLIDEAWHVAHGEDPVQHLDSNPPKPLQPISPSRPKRNPLEQPNLAGLPARASNRLARRKAAAERRREKPSLGAKPPS